MATTRHSPSNNAEPGTSFRSFWRKTGKNAQNDASGSQDVLGKEKKGRLSRFLASSSSPSSDGNDAGGTQSEAQKRRQQVYQAQKRHRNRKAEYTQSLEAEIARLRHLDAEVNSEKNTLSHQNAAMKELLASQSLDIQLDSIDLSSQDMSSDDPSASLNMRYDEHIEQERWFADLLNTASTQATSSDTSGPANRETQSSNTSVAGDSWAALDFILALEYPCRNHVHHPIISPNGWLPDPGEAHGHAMTATAAIFASAQPPSTSSGHSSTAAEKWHLPHTEIDKLVELSEGLATDDTEITPAQAYSAVREAVPDSAYLCPTLQTLKQPLAQLVHCAHFGSTLDTTLFWQHFDAAIESLRITRPELG